MEYDHEFLNTGVRVNQEYDELCHRLKEHDTRAMHLMSFEVVLSATIPDRPLWDYEPYISQAKRTPMPDDEFAELPFREFIGWMVVYETVMRSNGMIGRQTKVIAGSEEDVDEGD